ncbi:efflux RND transporter permease subunit [Paraglaciecola chathamensis]|uniref:Efflux pump membrane transporter n=2 Tax=Paraglaciecola chathamensis TaxID=368405 RepID=A0ABQ0I5A6_9ALTE|nr:MULTISPECIES: multidrug efflux RND transporter permease subunit [Paraglaciecola]GAC04535.1 multidrug resistance protein mexB [Paraglaciecola agarilytica NO2]GAC10007.1 multidrug resistance protein mexB [Paraglaciecola chathamensis S18K6]
MNISHFFIDRPKFASVLAIIVLIIGSLAYFSLPVEQYPQIAPPTVQVVATYPGASAEVAAKTVATPLEQEINGVENMLYMSSQSTADGRVTITVTFKLGTDLDNAQVQVQNRVAIAEPRLPETVRRLGITTKKNSPDLMLVVNMYSPNGTYDQTYIANYAALQIRDQLSRIDGVGDILTFGASQYSMRVWLDPDIIASLDMTASEVVTALQGQNIQVASGTLNQSPVDAGQTAFELNVQTQGQLIEPEEFENVIIKNQDGKIVRLRDVGRVELGAESYTTRGYLGDKKAVAMPVFQRPGSNAIKTADAIKAAMVEVAKNFPPDLTYEIAYNPTDFISESITAVEHTIYEAIALVVLVIMVFLQNWRAALIPIIAIPISLVGTFAVLSALGFSLNNLTLFGLVLAIGIVVDDAIVVVENMERLMAQGMRPLKAARQTMTEVGGAVLAIGLVLVAVFLPTAFVDGISGQFYSQFGITIAVATIISVSVSLILSPAISAVLFKPHKDESEKTGMFHYLSGKFNRGMDRTSDKYARMVSKLVRHGALVSFVYVLLMGFTVYMFSIVPKGFIPAQDQGYLIVGVQLPSGASLSRTDAVVQEAVDKLLSIEGVENAVAFAGFSGATFTNATNSAAIFAIMKSFDERAQLGATFDSVLGDARAQMSSIDSANVVVIPPPPVRGIGNGGGFKMMLEDRSGRGLAALEQAMWQLAGAANQEPATTAVFSFFETSTPQLYADIDRERVERLGVSVSDVFSALEIYLGSAFVNDFSYLGRTFRVTAQADAPYRMEADDIGRIRVRNSDGEMVPLSSVATFEYRSGPSRVPRYNLYPAADLIGSTAPGFSSGEAIATMERLAAEILPDGISYEWTELAYQEQQSGSTGMLAFAFAVVFVFLLLVALYESWTLPLSVILIVPMCLLSAIVGVHLMGLDNNILTQVGLIVLVGLASKNAILIVEFARHREHEGAGLYEAASDAAKLRLRPILMTSFAFILGVLPLAVATGAGAEMRQALGVAVFSGMLGVTFFGLIFTPVFYVLMRKLSMLVKGQKLDDMGRVPVTERE